jgi:hypothetical protein
MLKVLAEASGLKKDVKKFNLGVDVSLRWITITHIQFFLT